MIAEILFLLGIEYREGDSKLQCGIVAGLLHYTFLAAFAWMALEGIHLYLSLNQVFNVDNRSVFKQTAFAPGCGGVLVRVLALCSVVWPFSLSTMSMME